MLEPMLTGRTLSKIEIYGTNGEQWKPKMLELIEPDNLSSIYGGAVTCFDVCIPFLWSFYGLVSHWKLINLFGIFIFSTESSTESTLFHGL